MMKILKDTFLSKAFSVLRFMFVKLYYWRRVSVAGIGMVESGCEIYSISGGVMRLGRKVIIRKGTEIQSRGKLSIGSHVIFNPNCRVVAFEEIKIGDNVTVARMTSILDHDHNYFLADEQLTLSGYNMSPIVIGSNVWIGEKVTILRGVTVGSNVVIGAGSIVSRDIPNNCIAAGVPCKPLKYLD